VAHRLQLAEGKTPLAVEQGLVKVIPEKYMRHAHHWLILHGRYVCQARKPRCDVCIVNDLCRSADKWYDGPPPSLGAQPRET
jgi:endonuclease-3